MKMIRFILVLALLIGCVGCSASHEESGEQAIPDIKYTYTPKEMTWATPPDSYVLRCSSFEQIKSAFNQAVIDEASFDAYQRQISSISGWRFLNIRSRDEFLTMYDMLKDITILVPDDPSFKLYCVTIGVIYQEKPNKIYDIMVLLTYTTPQGNRIDFEYGTHFANPRLLSSHYPYKWRESEDALPVYQGDGFEAHTKSHSYSDGTPSKDSHLTVDGVDIGYMSSRLTTANGKIDVYCEDVLNRPLTLDDVAGVLDCFETANFHEVVQTAKEPK